METSKTEKEWFRRINGQHPMTTDDKEAKTTDASVQHAQKTMIRKQGHGFNDVAGMDKLKQMVREEFVNVLQNRELADVYGIRPPSSIHALLWSGRMWQVVLCRENGRRGRDSLHKGGT